MVPQHGAEEVESSMLLLDSRVADLLSCPVPLGDGHARLGLLTNEDGQFLFRGKRPNHGQRALRVLVKFKHEVPAPGVMSNARMHTLVDHKKEGNDVILRPGWAPNTKGPYLHCLK